MQSFIIPFRPQFTSSVVSVDLPGNAAMPVFWLGNAAPVSAPAPAGDALPTAATNIPWWQITAAVWLAGMLLHLFASGLVRLQKSRPMSHCPGHYGKSGHSDWGCKLG